MFVVALIGPDGAGKTTIGRRLAGTLSMPVRYVYMGVNYESSNLMLPSTRLLLAARRALRRGKGGSRSAGAAREGAAPRRTSHRHAALGLARRLYSALWMANVIAEECYRQLAVGRSVRRGHLVIIDRWFFADYYDQAVAPGAKPRSLLHRLHGFLLRSVYARPDLVIYLDAPAQVLFDRKGEGTLESLERQRQGYLRLREVVDRFAVVDATQAEESVAQDVAALIEALGRTRESSHDPALSRSR